MDGNAMRRRPTQTLIQMRKEMKMLSFIIKKEK
jgi:hypothetical protein